MRIDADSPVTLAAEVLVDAPVAVVWDVIADVRAWPTWHPGIRSVVTDRDPGPQMTFRWKSGPYRIDSTVQEFEAAGPHWLDGPLTGRRRPARLDGSSRRWRGLRRPHRRVPDWPAPAAVARQLSQRVQQDLDNWLGHLKVEAERRSRT